MCAGASLSFTLTANNGTGYCVATSSSSSTFTVGTADNLTVAVGTDPNLAACTSEADILTAYNAWKAGFVVLGGCSPTDNILADFPALTDLTCGGQLSFTLNASNIAGGCVDTASDSSTFTVGVAPLVTVSSPNNVSDSACDYTDQADLTAAYDAWLAGFTVTGAGCGATGSFAITPPVTVDYCLGANISATWSANDGCSNDEKTATFVVTKPLPPTLTGTPYKGTEGTNTCATDATGLFVFDALAAATGYSDDCGAAVTAVETGTEVVTGDDCSWAVTYTFKIVDACGNELLGQSYSHTGGDKTKPTAEAPANVIISKDAACSYLGEGTDEGISTSLT